MIKEVKTFQIIKDHARSAAELSHLEGRTYYFNRLIVDSKLRGHGLSIQLMNQVIEWADQEKYDIILHINPYGNLDYIQLANFYMRFGFEWDDQEENRMIRKTKDRCPCCNMATTLPHSHPYPINATKNENKPCNCGFPTTWKNKT